MSGTYQLQRESERGHRMDSILVKENKWESQDTSEEDGKKQCSSMSKIDKANSL